MPTLSALGSFLNTPDAPLPKIRTLPSDAISLITFLIAFVKSKFSLNSSV